MAKLADAPDLGSGVHDVQVQVLLSAGVVEKLDFMGFSKGERVFPLDGEGLFFAFDINSDINRSNIDAFYRINNV